MSDAQIAARALRSLDLTDLTDNCTDQAIDALCRKALDERGPVAAVCVWPQFVKRAQANLKARPCASRRW
jgi:deoxyribose-phosphate aldolase